MRSALVKALLCLRAMASQLSPDWILYHAVQVSMIPSWVGDGVEGPVGVGPGGTELLLVGVPPPGGPWPKSHSTQ